MKTDNLLAVVTLSLLCTFISSCKKEAEEVIKKDESTNAITHTGEKWNITSVEYNIIDQNLTNLAQSFKSGTKANAGAFYFDGAQGSFDISVETYHMEDVYSYTMDSVDVTISSIEQQVGGASVSQHVIAITGQKDTQTSMEIDGTITRQSLTGQFVFTGTFTLTKE